MEPRVQLRRAGVSRLLMFQALDLSGVAEAWKQADQEQRNRLARVLFEEVKLDAGGEVAAARPRRELKPFFRISCECHARAIAGDSEGDRVPMCNTRPMPQRPSAPRSQPLASQGESSAHLNRQVSPNTPGLRACEPWREATASAMSR